MSSKRIFSGIQPSGNLHIGNYLGAIKQWIDLQNTETNELLFCIVDLHAITVPQSPDSLRQNSLELAALYIASGLDSDKSTVFIQSENPDHSYLSWVFNCITPMGWMERMTQYKDKSTKQGERTSVGLFDYPALMAADILLYDTDIVPVGEDQSQHIELTRDIAARFNTQFGETFKVPEIMLQKETARIMSLQDPEKKMSKSDESQSATIGLADDPDTIAKKIRKAVTDSGSDIKSGKDKPAISNLLSIYSAFSGKSIPELELEYSGKSYGDFKNDLSELVVSKLQPIQEKFETLMDDRTELNKVLDDGKDASMAISSQKIKAVQKAVGLGR